MASLLYALLPAVFLALALTPEAAGQSDLVVVSVNRTTAYNAFGWAYYTFNIKFTATAEPTVDWMTGFLSRTKLAAAICCGGSLTHDESTGQGSASITVMHGLSLLVQIGQPTQFFSLPLDTRFFHEERFHELNLQASTVSPSMDASYDSSAGGIPIQTITTNNVMGDGVTLLPNSLTYYGNHHYSNAEAVFYTQPSSRDQGKTVTTDASGDDTTVFSFGSPPGVGVASGYYSGYYFGINTAVNSSISKFVWETFSLRVHADSETGPFPDDEVFVRFPSERKTCRAGGFCSILCDAYGNDVGDVTISKVYENGTTEELPSAHLVTLDPFWKSSVVYLSAYEDRTGSYKCEATGATADVTGEGSITVTDMGTVELESLTLDTDTTTVTCHVTGDAITPVMKVFRCLSREEQEDLTVTWAPDDNAEGSIASIDLSVSSEGCLYVACVVYNTVSYDSVYINVFQ